MTPLLVAGGLDGAAREIVAQAREAAEADELQQQRELLEDGE